MVGLLGKKLGMTQVFDEKGNVIPVTVLQLGPCYALQVINKPDSGYCALQLGFDERKTKGLPKARSKFFEKTGIKPQRFIQEVRLPKEELGDCKVGQVIDVDVFKDVARVDVQGTSIGKGFQGGMKRWGWHGGPKTHGSMSHRRPGSIGSSADPSRVFRGRHLPGRMGNQKVTVKNLKVVSIDADKHIIMVKGAVPGCDNGYIIVRKSKKKVKAHK